MVLDEFHAYHSVPYENIPIGLFHKFPELMEPLAGLPVGCQALLRVPLGGIAFLACGNGGTLSVYGDTAEDDCPPVCLCLLSVDIEQYLECTSHCLDVLKERIINKIIVIRIR
jgi:hypothetical protein